MEFGGGLSRFRHQCPNNNECRELVEVPGGSEWKIRRLQNEFEQFCWKYTGCSVIVNYHFFRIKNQKNIEQELDDDPNRNLFYGKVSHFMSPVEISIQPKYLSSARKSIIENMTITYNFGKGNELRLSDEQVFEGVSCAVKESEYWYRGQVVQVSGQTHVNVELIDFGVKILIDRSNVRPLLKQFGRIPPLCLKCQVDGVSINDLETKDLLEFKTIVEECNSLFRIELKSTEEPYLIDIYHPTISGKNVCEKFFPPPEDDGKQARLDRNWVAHCRKVNEEFEEDEDDYWNHNWIPQPSGDSENYGRVIRKYLTRLDKCEKGPRFEKDPLIVSHVENCQLIYVQYLWQVEERNKIDSFLKDHWKEFMTLPRHLMKIDQLCGLRKNSRIFRRSIITEIHKNSITFIELDYGTYTTVSTGSFDMKLLPAIKPIDSIPMITVLSLFTHFPHHSETLIIRELIITGSRIFFKWDKKSKNTPLRGKVLNQNGDDISKQLFEYLSMRRQNVTCRQVDFYRPRFSTLTAVAQHIYRTACHPHYSKGSKEVIEI